MPTRFKILEFRDLQTFKDPQIFEDFSWYLEANLQLQEFKTYIFFPRILLYTLSLFSS